MNKVKKLVVILFTGIVAFYAFRSIETSLQESENVATTLPWTHNSTSYTSNLRLHVDPYVVNSTTASSDDEFSDNASIDFTVSKDFSFPHLKALSSDTIIGRDHHGWAEKLKSVMNSWNGERRVIMVTSNSAYKDVLLNWLLSAVLLARVPIEQILVVAHDEPIWLLMRERDISSILVPPNSLFPVSVNVSPFGQIMMTRISVMRLLNHWRFDVVMVDTDALLLKNPWTLFDQFPESGIIASMGHFPSELSRRWGVALCVGVILIRSSNQTENFWKVMSKIQPKSFSDQGRINYGLDALGVRWEATAGGSFEGMCMNKLKVNTLTYSHVCRSNCNRKQMNSYYVWHKPAPRDGMSKRKSASQGDIWLLSPTQWTLVCGNLKGKTWLKCIHK